MERPLNALALPATHVDVAGWTSPWVRLLGLWRHAVWASLFFGVCAASVSVRLDVQQLRVNLDRNARFSQQAQVLQERLQLEQDVRRRSAAVEAVAEMLVLTDRPAIILVREAFIHSTRSALQMRCCPVAPLRLHA